MIDGWLLYNREDYERNRVFAERFLNGCGSHSLALRLVFREEACLQLSAGSLSAGGGLPAFAINRTRDWLIGGALEQAGCRVFNCAEVCRIGNDKIASHLLAARLGLPQVDMAFCANAPDALVRHGLGYPVVIKDPRGHGGSGVFMANDEMELQAIATELPCYTVLLQRPCGTPGVDVRAYMLGGRVLAAVRRTSTADFRANLSLGGTAERYRLGRAELDIVKKVTRSLRLDYAGIDFIYDGQGRPLFNEIEDAVGSRSLYILGGPDAADECLKHIAGEMKRRADC